jgi:hypothetical protein
MKTVATFMHAHQAHFLRIRLEEEGIPAIVCDEATSALAPHFIHAIGGIRVQVRDEDVAAASAVVGLDEPMTDLREGMVCPECGSSDIDQELNARRSYVMSFLLLFLIMLPLPFVKRQYRCNQCSHLWR